MKTQPEDQRADDAPEKNAVFVLLRRLEVLKMT